MIWSRGAVGLARKTEVAMPIVAFSVLYINLRSLGLSPGKIMPFGAAFVHGGQIYFARHTIE
jgi:hypothetical protein